MTEETFVQLRVLACLPVPGSQIVNSCFHNASTPWRFYGRSAGEYNLTQDYAYVGSSSARISISLRETNLQFNQRVLQLEPKITYKLSSAARSNSGRDMSVWVHGHTSTNPEKYGLRNYRVKLARNWKEFETTFTTPNLPELGGARPRFFFRSAPPGTVLGIDEVVLVKT